MFKKKNPRLNDSEYEMLDSFMLIGRYICQESGSISSFLKPVLKEIYEEHYTKVGQPAPVGNVGKVSERNSGVMSSGILSEMTDGRI